jgi:D-lactate dehydrogenase
MGCRVLCQDAYENAALKALPNVEYVELSQLLAESDVISMHAPLNPTTDHLINDETIAIMKGKPHTSI